LALDHGARRIGVAVSDPLGVLAQPLETISRSDARPGAELARIAALVD
jgi:RNase H-fold protein (predicted Holliday junction resolvase)